eukprot:799254_1
MLETVIRVYVDSLKSRKTMPKTNLIFSVRNVPADRNFEALSIKLNDTLRTIWHRATNGTRDLRMDDVFDVSVIPFPDKFSRPSEYYAVVQQVRHRYSKKPLDSRKSKGANIRSIHECWSLVWNKVYNDDNLVIAGVLMTQVEHKKRQEQMKAAKLAKLEAEKEAKRQKKRAAVARAAEEEAQRQRIESVKAKMAAEEVARRERDNAEEARREARRATDAAEKSNG